MAFRYYIIFFVILVICLIVVSQGYFNNSLISNSIQAISSFLSFVVALLLCLTTFSASSRARQAEQLIREQSESMKRQAEETAKLANAASQQVAETRLLAATSIEQTSLLQKQLNLEQEPNLVLTYISGYTKEQPHFALYNLSIHPIKIVNVSFMDIRTMSLKEVRLMERYSSPTWGGNNPIKDILLAGESIQVDVFPYKTLRLFDGTMAIIGLEEEASIVEIKFLYGPQGNNQQSISFKISYHSLSNAWEPILTV